MGYTRTLPTYNGNTHCGVLFFHYRRLKPKGVHAITIEKEAEKIITDEYVFANVLKIPFLYQTRTVDQIWSRVFSSKHVFTGFNTPTESIANTTSIKDPY